MTSAARPAGRSPSLADRLARTGVRCAQVPAAVATPSFVRRAHALGLQVHAWTVNEPEVMHGLLDLGVDGIMTDQTVALRDVLISRGQWYPRPGKPGTVGIGHSGNLDRVLGVNKESWQSAWEAATNGRTRTTRDPARGNELRERP